MGAIHLKLGPGRQCRQQTVDQWLTLKKKTKFFSHFRCRHREPGPLLYPCIIEYRRFGIHVSGFSQYFLFET